MENTACIEWGDRILGGRAGSTSRASGKHSAHQVVKNRRTPLIKLLMGDQLAGVFPKAVPAPLRLPSSCYQRPDPQRLPEGPHEGNRFVHGMVWIHLTRGIARVSVWKHVFHTMRFTVWKPVAACRWRSCRSAAGGPACSGAAHGPARGAARVSPEKPSCSRPVVRPGGPVHGSWRDSQ